MKKLISVFAALALVGSLAAQKKKPAAKPAPAAPAAPTVAAPAAPVVAAPAMPASGAAGKGMGLTVQGYGLFALSNGSSTSAPDGSNSVTGTNDTAITYKLSGSSAFGGGLAVAYDIAENLAVAASFDYRSFSTRKYSNVAAAASGGTSTTQQKWQNMIIGLGFRPSVKALGGTFYGGAGAALVLPFSTTFTTEFSDAATGLNGVNVSAVNSLSGNFIAAPGVNNTKKLERVKEYNMGIGAYGEIGYLYEVSGGLFFGVGVKAIVATVNNDGKTGKTTRTGDTTSTDTTTYKSSFSTTDNTNEQAAGTATDSKRLAQYESLGVTDINFLISAGMRF